ncbi:MAG: rane protein [Frankiales bacterium]|nr:rane protein [Frankiales bacterium]
MMIQATVPSALGLLFTRWMFDSLLILAVVATLASVVHLLVLFRRDPEAAAVRGRLYLAFAAALVADLN